MTMRSRLRSVLACLLILQPMCAFADGDREEHQQSADVYCGPRCVRHLLQHFRQPDCGILELADEMNMHDAGVSLGDIKASLERRGLKTATFSVPEGEMIESYSPVIMHLNSKDHKSQLGHFCILMPTSTPTRCDIWVGLEGVQTGSPVDARKLMSGSALVVDLCEPAASSRKISSVRIWIAMHAHFAKIMSPLLVLNCVCHLCAPSSDRVKDDFQRRQRECV